MKKSASTLLIFPLLISACSPSERIIQKEVQPVIIVPPKSDSKKDNSEPTKKIIFDEVTLQDLSSLLKFQNPESKTIEMLITEFKSQHPTEMESWLQPLDSKQLLQLSEGLKKEREENSLKYFIGENRPSGNSAYLAATSMNNLMQMSSSGVFANKIELQVAVMGQSAALRNIFDVLNKQMEMNSRLVAKKIVANWNTTNPEAIKAVDKILGLEPRKRISVIQEALIKYDPILAKYDFSDDGSKLMIYGLVAGVMADSLNKTGTIKDLLNGINEVINVSEKIGEIRLSIATLDQYRRDLKKNWEDVSSAFKTIKEDLAYYKNSGGFELKKLKVTDRTKAELSRAVGDVLEGKFHEKALLAKNGVFTLGHELGKNVEDFLHKATLTADSFSNVIDSVQIISKQMGVQISPELSDALHTATKVSEGVKLGSAIIQAYSSGGLVSALSAFSGGPVTAVLGGSMAMMAQQQNEMYFKAIQDELVEIKKLQNESVRLQKDTLQIIKSLAVMVDEYHKEDLFQMKQIYHQVIVNTEISSMVLRKDLRSCQSILSYISMGGPIQHDEYSPITTIENVEGVWEIIKKTIQSPRQIPEILTSSSELDIERCRNAMSEAFDRVADFGTPLFARFYVKEGSAQAEIESKLYSGALSFLESIGAEGNSLEDMALHLPVAKMDALQMKEYYVSTRGNRTVYDYSKRMENLLSPEGLEAYVASLLSLHSLISVNKNDWESNNALMNASYSRNRSMMWVKGALAQVRTSIAQDALLVGEPILTTLAAKWSQIAAETSLCKDSNDRNNYHNFCFVRQNPLMLKNLVTFMLHQYVGKIAPSDYENKIPAILGIKPDQIFSENGKIFLSFSEDKAFRVELPTLEEAKIGYISYSESMPKLLKMQKLIAEEAAKLNPSELANSDVETFTKLLISM
jgi:hypothetical protein